MQSYTCAQNLKIHTAPFHLLRWGRMQRPENVSGHRSQQPVRKGEGGVYSSTPHHLEGSRCLSLGLSSSAPPQSSEPDITWSSSSQERAPACWAGSQKRGHPSPLLTPSPGGCEKQRLWKQREPGWTPTPARDLSTLLQTPQASVSSPEEWVTPCSAQGHCKDDKPCLSSPFLLLGFPKKL